MRSWFYIAFIVAVMWFAISHFSDTSARTNRIKKLFSSKKTMVAQAYVEQEVKLSAPEIAKPKKQTEEKDVLSELILSPEQQDIYTVLDENKHLWGEIFDQSKGAVSKLGKCLKTLDRCGERRDNGYFDPNRTSTHADLNRVLMAMQEIVRQSPSFYNDLNRNEIIGLTEINNNNTPILAAQLLLTGDVSDGEFSQMLSNAKSLTGPVRAMYLSVLANPPAPLKQAHVSAVFAALANRNDRYTAMEVQKKLAQYNLTQSQFVAAIKKSCYLSNDGSGENLWPIVRRNIAVQSQAMGYILNPDKLGCQAPIVR